MAALTNDSPYSIMFGPDKCFRDTNKVWIPISDTSVCVSRFVCFRPVLICSALMPGMVLTNSLTWFVGEISVLVGFVSPVTCSYIGRNCAA